MTDVTCLENEFRPHRHIVLEYEFGESSTFSYLMGNTKPTYIDMTPCEISPVRCLFLGSGDLRNVLYLISTSPTVTEWEFDLVDNNPAIVARNFLFLQILNDETVSVDILWNIWYDLTLNKKVYSYLQHLIRKFNLNNLDLIDEVSRPVIAKVFEEWSVLFESVVTKKVIKQRHDHLLYCIERICRTALDEFIELVCESVTSVFVNENPTTIGKAKNEIKRYTEDGTTGLTKNQEYINITMLQSSSGTYTGHYSMYPYEGYIPFETSEEQEEFQRITTAQNSNPLTTYCKNKLEQWVKIYRQRRQKIKWHLWYGDALSLALFSMPLIEFDLIHTSNLCDHIGILNLLITCINFLRHRSWSRILTQSMQWRTTFARYNDYLSHLFNNVEISWFPSLLGLICECTRTVGCEQHKGMGLSLRKFNLIDSYDYQIWRLAINVQAEPHLRLDGSDVNVLEVLEKLAERCFYTHLTKPEASEGVGHSTTLTYFLLLRQYCLRCCVHPDESFEYLFERTCNRFRAYTTGLRALRNFFSNNNIHMYTSNNHISTEMNTFSPIQIQTPVLQIVIIECNEKTMYTLLNSMHTNTFKETTKASVTSNEMSYDLRTGTMIHFSDPQKLIKFHLIDDFIFKLTTKSAREKDTLPEFYVNLVHNAQVQFILPAFFSPSFHTALLIDIRTWFPFAKFQLTNPITICSNSSYKALAIRDAISSCYANISDRRVYFTNTSTIQIVNAFETTSSFHVLINIQTQSSSWTHTQNLILSGHVLVINIKFAQSNIYLLRLAFSCPLNLHQSKFQANIKKGTLTITLAKNIAELLSLTTFNREINTVLFDSTTAKQWPPPRLANGRLLDVGLNFPSPIAVGNYDSETMVVHEALTAMFTLPEMQLARGQSGDHLFRDADFDLRESIRHMYLQAFCGRQRVALYSTKMASSSSATDVRTFGDILLLYEGIYNFSGRPILAISYLDMMEIIDADVVYLTQYVQNLVRTEMQTYASIIAQTRSVPRSIPSDFDVREIRASKEELDLMRQLFTLNRVKTKGTHRNDLHGPWHASFIEPLRADSRSLLLSTKLTRDSGIDIEKDAFAFFQCQVCKKIPPDPSKLWPKCSQCKGVNYCSTNCQAQDWSNHKKICRRYEKS